MLKKVPILTFLILVITTQFSFAENVTIKSRQEGVTLPGILTKPQGDGPFPAVVLLHGAGGFKDSKPRTESWSNRLVSWGYVTLAIDSFPEGRFSATSALKSGMMTATLSHRCGDAHDAKSYLAQLPFVYPAQIAVIGWSHGGWTILWAVSSQTQSQIPIPIQGQDSPFAAAIAFYPRCNRPLDTNAPLMILIGKEDNWAPPSGCEFYMPGEAGYFLPNEPQHEVILKIYPGATHDFDWPGVENENDSYHTLKYDPDATADAAVRIKNFLSKYLK
jgi:dienelactone hydrolase